MIRGFQPTLFEELVDSAAPTGSAVPPGSAAPADSAPPAHPSAPASLGDRPVFTPLPRTGVRTALSGGAWVELHHNWLRGAGGLLGALIDAVDWRAERRAMYDRVVDVPRLIRFYGERDTAPHPVVARGLAELSDHYGPELGERFTTVGMCFYRDGADSVAWHGDTSGRGAVEDTMVAILSLGAERTLSLRPRRPAHDAAPDGTAVRSITAAPGGTLRYPLAHGDLIVMGGSCQRTWEHCIPKSARAAGPRISIQFRPRGVR